MLSAGFVLPSCDKAKKLLHLNEKKAEPTVGDAPGGQIDPALAAQISRKDGDVCFRKDLPFPTKLKVKTEELIKWSNGHKTTRSALGAEVKPFDGDYSTVIDWSLDNGLAKVQVEAAGPLILPEKDRDPKTPPKVREEVDELLVALGKSVALHQRAGAWEYAPTSKERDFREMVWAKDLAPTAPDLFAGAGLLPRQRWFSSTRSWKAGDTVELTGESLLLLFPGRPTGSVILTFEEVEALSGHPAGRFSIKGSVNVSSMPIPEGGIIDADIAISSGKIWCSLLHPVILREDYEAVESITRGTINAPNTKIQGTAKILRARSWKMD